MSEKVTGLVVETNRLNCIILTPDGDFVEAVKPLGRKLNLGEEATLFRHRPFQNYRRLAMVACLLIAIISWTAYSSYVPAAVAYVSLDINPSLELAVNRQGQVIKVACFNPEAEKLLGQVSIKGKPFTEAIENLIDSAVNLKYLDPEKTNEILVTVEIESPTSTEVINQKMVEDTITRSIAKNNVEAELSVTPVKPSLRQEANQEKVSTGRYLLYQEQKNHGNPVEIKELQKKGLDDLGYHNWSPEKIKHLPKNQPNPTNKSGSKNQSYPMENKKPGQWTDQSDSDSDKNTGSSYSPGQNKGKDDSGWRDDEDKEDTKDKGGQTGDSHDGYDRGHKQTGNGQEHKNESSDYSPSGNSANGHNYSYQNHIQSEWNKRMEALKKQQSERGKAIYHNNED